METASTAEQNTTPEETQAAVSEKIKKKGRSAVAKKNKVLKALSVVYCSVDDLKPNDYNPNRQSEHDFELLLSSMREDGFTQPIVALKDSKIIVDGEHRWRAARTLGFDEIPVVFTDMTPEQMRISTLRHNRARGSEDINLTANVLRDLQELGATEWAQDSLMMSDSEMNRILEDLTAPEELAGEDFTTSWSPDQVGEHDREMAEKDSGESYVIEEKNDGTVHVGAMSEKAAGDIRTREKIIKEAKTTEERNMALKQRDLYRISLIFSGDEAKIVRPVLGKKPAIKILAMCKEQGGLSK